MDTNNPASAIKPIYRTFKGQWDGDSKIVIGIDIGTTHSGVAFTFLVKGGEQMLHRVTQWPGQQNSQGKVPSLIWYNSDSQPELFGAEAQTPEAELEAEDNGWELAKHFKLHLHPPDLLDKHNLVLEPLPSGVSLRQVYSDFLRYLLEQTQRSFEARIVDGKKIWQDYRPNMEVVIGHPNGYGTRQQALLRSAAVAAGFTASEQAETHIRFVTEAEASVHFCLHYTDLKSRLYPGTSFAVCDAGGSTVDTTLYTVETMSPRLRLAEERESSCIQAGAIFIDKLAELYLRRLFENAGLPSDELNEYTIAGARDFEAQAKRSFYDAGRDSLVKIAGSRCNIPGLRIRRGKLTLTGTTVQSFFDRCVKEIIASVDLQVSSTSVPYILLVGGFGESPYLGEQLRSRFGPSGTHVTTTDEAASKAVADGALIWHCANSVIKRAPHLAFGVHIWVPFDPHNKDHQHRIRDEGPSGTHVLGRWSQIVAKGVPIDSDAISRKPYIKEYHKANPDSSDINVQVYGYSLDKSPDWLTTESGELHEGFQPVCIVNADISGLRNTLKRRINARGVQYWTLSLDICIIFGRTELEAYIEWVEEGVTRTGPAKIIPITDLELEQS